MQISTIAEALGNGILSIPVTLFDGIKRTAEFYGSDTEKEKIEQQNYRAYEAIKNLVVYGVESYNSPLEKTIRIILEFYYSSLPESEKSKLKTAAEAKGIYIGAKYTTNYAISLYVSKIVLKRIVADEGARKLISFLSKSELTLLSILGLLYKAGEASDHLKASLPRLWFVLRQNNLDMLYFIVEKPMQKYINSIRMNRLKIHKQLR